MADFTVLVLKIAFLAILWLFIIVVTVVVHSDMVGRRQKRSRRREQLEEQSSQPIPQSQPSQPASSRAARPKHPRKEPWVLAIDSGIHAGDRLQLVPQVHIGRSDACELVLDDDYVSSMHAMLRHHDDGTWALEDLGSTNGTFVNSVRVSDPTIVGVNDIIRIGGVQMRLEL